MLEPIERISEVLFGLIMVLTFTGSLSVAEAGREDVRTMLIGALGCNLAWGIIDGVLYLMGCLAEKGRGLHDSSAPCAAPPIRSRRSGSSPTRCRRWSRRSCEPAELETMRQRLKQLPEPPRTRAPEQGRLAGRRRRFSAGVPLHVPGGDSVHCSCTNAGPALRVSNAIAIVMLFLTGYAYGRMTGRHPWLMGISMVVLGLLLVGMTMALGG